MIMKEKEIEGIETVGDLRRALADAPDDMALGDEFGEGLCLVLTTDYKNDPYIEVR